MRRAAHGTVIPNGKNPPKIRSSPQVISRVFPYMFLQFYMVTSVSGCLCFTFNFFYFQIVAVKSMNYQFHEFFKNLIFGRLLQFGPTVLGRVVGSVDTFVRTLEKKITENSFLWGFHICLWWRWGRAACFLVISFHFFIP